jgi:tRNA-dihydrouridine synthase C
VSELVVHARTKAQGYRPPAYWSRLADIRAAVPGLQVVANGDIWTADDAQQCRRESGCDALMLGRGMVSNPGLARTIAQPGRAALTWCALQPLIDHFWRLIESRVEPRHRAGRLKQWLNFLRRCYPQAEALYAVVRAVNDPTAITALLAREASREMVLA